MSDETVTLQVETMDLKGPFGAKSLGEVLMIPIAPTIANATGSRIKELPITPE
jgi:CO/xanthine dehydrogenase Mo-binding subunit